MLLISTLSRSRLLKPRDPHRQPRFHHFKLAPCHLNVARRQRKILAMVPLRLNHLAGSQSQQPAHAKIAYRNAHRKIHWQPENGSRKNGLLFVLLRLWRRN